MGKFQPREADGASLSDAAITPAGGTRKRTGFVAVLRNKHFLMIWTAQTNSRVTKGHLG